MLYSLIQGIQAQTVQVHNASNETIEAYLYFDATPGWSRIYPGCMSAKIYPDKKVKIVDLEMPTLNANLQDTCRLTIYDAATDPDGYDYIFVEYLGCGEYTIEYRKPTTNEKE